MIIDTHVHPIFQETIQELSSTPAGAHAIYNIELTSKTYYDRNPNILSLRDFQKEMIPWNLFEKTVPNKILLGSDYPARQTLHNSK